MLKMMLLILALLTVTIGCSKSSLTTRNLQSAPVESIDLESVSCQPFSKGKWCEAPWSQYVEFSCGCSLSGNGWVPQADNCFHRLTQQYCQTGWNPEDSQCQIFSEGEFCNSEAKLMTEFSCGCDKNQNEGWVPQEGNCWHRMTQTACNRGDSTTPEPPPTNANWINPIGVPTPAFGVAETRPAFPTNWDQGQSSVNGFQFYFVCPTCNGSTDNSNTFGTPSKPRQSIPGTVTGPAVVVLKGQFDLRATFTANGTAAGPVFVTSFDSANPAKLTVRQTVRGNYVIFENLWFGPQNSSDTDFGLDMYEGVHHAVVRKNTFRGNSNRSGGIGLGSWGYAGSDKIAEVVIDQNDIQNIGNTAATSDQDAHCINISGSAEKIWITNNTLAYCSGDGVQIEAQTGRNAFIHHIYVGKNHMYHNRQSGGWSKNATDVIFSQNKAHDFRSNSGGPGVCYGHQFGANYVWYLFNEGYSCNIGINIGGTDSNSQYTFVIGNLIHDTASQVRDNVYAAGAINIRGTRFAYVANNTMYNVDAGGIFINDSGLEKVFYHNNLIHGRSQSALFDFYSRNVSLDIRNNLFTASPRLAFNNSSYSTVQQFQSVAGGSVLLSGDARLNSDFSLAPDSPALNKGMLSPAYQIFKDRYGIDIRVDFRKRVQSNWNIGAFGN